MMFKLMIGTHLMLIVILLVCHYLVVRLKMPGTRLVSRMILMAIICSIFYVGFMLIPNDNITTAYTIGGMFYFSTDLLSLYFLFFVLECCEIKVEPRWIVHTQATLIVLDLMLFTINVFKHNVFELKYLVADNAAYSYWEVSFQKFSMLHILIAYSLTLVGFVILIITLIRKPAVYKKKYLILTIEAFVLICLSAFGDSAATRFDYSVYLYAVFAICICHELLYASPRQIVERISRIIVDDSVNAAFFFDYNGQCIGINDTAEAIMDSDGKFDKAKAEAFLVDWRLKHVDYDDDLITEDLTRVVNGEKKFMQINYQVYRDERERCIGYGFVLEDRTDVVNRYREEKHRSTHDSLTGLLNRNGFEREGARLVKESKDEYYMLCTNIKDFKLVNNVYGTEIGDALLLRQAELCKEAEKKGCICARIFADRFGIIMPRDAYSEQMIMEISSELAKTRDLDKHFKLQYMVGVYEITDKTEHVWSMYDKALMAVDLLQQEFGRTIGYYGDELLAEMVRERKVLDELDGAIENEEFCMYLQPQVHADGSLVGAEALVRWKHPEKGLISPYYFIPPLEKTGLIYKVDRYMWELVAKKLVEWESIGFDATISVNVSTKDFYFVDVYETFYQLYKKYNFRIDKYKIEITESAIMDNIKSNLEAIDKLRQLGFQVEMDDFGNGYSSLGMLKDIKVDILKIDMSFLGETVDGDNKRNKIIIKNIIKMAEELTIPVIVEGTETREQVDFLSEVGCEVFQGYYFAKPMGVLQFEEKYGVVI